MPCDVCVTVDMIHFWTTISTASPVETLLSFWHTVWCVEPRPSWQNVTSLTTADLFAGVSALTGTKRGDSWSKCSSTLWFDSSWQQPLTFITLHWHVKECNNEMVHLLSSFSDIIAYDCSLNGYTCIDHMTMSDQIISMILDVITLSLYISVEFENPKL